MKKLSVLLIVMCLAASVFAGGSSEQAAAPAAAKAPIDLKVWSVNSISTQLQRW